MSYQAEPIETIEYKGMEIKLWADENPINPREWDQLGIMLCSHRRYQLGDTQINEAEFDSWEEVEKRIEEEENGINILRLRLYDHSGITISVSSGYPYNDRWDSGTVGFIYTTPAKLIRMGLLKNLKDRIGKKLQERINKSLLAEVAEYDDYLRGSVYGFTITDHGADVDSGWGFYGKEGYKYMIGEAKSIVDYTVSEEYKHIELGQWYFGEMTVSGRAV
jgi:hypothetical protein